MRTYSTNIAATALLAGFSAALPSSSLLGRSGRVAPRYQPSGAVDGWPNPNPQQQAVIASTAGGQLSNAQPPAFLSVPGQTAFQLIAFNELFEVAFFSSLLDNVTNSVSGFTVDDADKKTNIINILTTVKAQEQMHAISAKSILDHFGAFAPPPCDYHFPTTTLNGAIDLAETFTSLVLGTLQDAVETLAKNNDDGPARAIASVIGQEGEQNGYYRTFMQRRPSEKPFLTTSIAPYAFSALQSFIKPGSCPFSMAQLNIPIFPTLNLGTGDVSAQDQTLTFSANLTGSQAASSYVGGSGNGLFVTYLTGQNTPVSMPISNLMWNGAVATFNAYFPYTTNQMDGLSIAALTTTSTFGGPEDLPAATLAAPALIKVNGQSLQLGPSKLRRAVMGQA